MDKNDKREVLNDLNSAPSEEPEEAYTIPNETSCSAEFPQGCISGE